MNRTINDLTVTLADALGLPRRLVDETARHLREANMLADGGALATVEHAVVLLLGLMAAPEPKDAPDSVRLYRQLPLDRVTRCELMPDGRFETVQVLDEDLFVADLHELGTAFGPHLETLIRTLSAIEEVDIEIGGISVGGGIGTATASIHILVLAEGVDVGGVVQFTLAPLGGPCRHPDDAPPARIDFFASVPGSIFSVFRKFFSGSASAPRKTAISRAEVAALVTEK